MKKGIIIAVIALVVIGGGVFALMQGNKKNTLSTTPVSVTPKASKQPASSSTPASGATPANGATPASGSSKSSTGTISNTSSTNSTSSANSTPAPAAPATEAFSITANDDSASPETINVKKGDTIKLTFNVSTAGTYHGGLEFKSTDPALDSGSIAEGSSGTVTFTATSSFKFTPYWYQSNVQKDYFVSVNVQ